MDSPENNKRQIILSTDVSSAASCQNNSEKKEGSGLARENAWTSRPDAKKDERAQQHMTAEVQSCSNKHKKPCRASAPHGLFLSFCKLSSASYSILIGNPL